jgi:DnaJ-class molecular chaperone
MDFCEILEIRREAAPAVVKRAYRKNPGIKQEATKHCPT